MANLDRAGIIERLELLGAEDDETVLRTARELHREVAASGATWDELLRGQDEPAATTEEMAEADEAADDAHTEPAEAPVADLPVDDSEDGRLIERLLARPSLSADLRSDLTDMKRDLAEGNFGPMDRRYVRALAERLGG